MRRIELGTIGIVALWIIVILLLIAMNGSAKAQDTQVSSCYTRTDAGAVFTFSNVPDEWLGERGWYYVGDNAALDGHMLTVTGLQFDGGYSYAIVGTSDYSESVTAATDTTPECAPAPQQQRPVVPVPNVDKVMSTGRMCVVKYPQIVLVCNG